VEEFTSKCSGAHIKKFRTDAVRVRVDAACDDVAEFGKGSPTQVNAGITGTAHE
jgi:hypothetical protein